MLNYYKVPSETGYQLEARPEKVDVLEQHEIAKEQYEAELTAIRQHAAAVDQYTAKVQAGEITLDDVPEAYRAEVEFNLAEPENPNKYGLTDEQIAEIEQDYRDRLTQEVRNDA